MASWILPRHGGGWVRRYLAFRKDLFWTNMTTKDRYPCPPVTLFDFGRPHDAADAARIQEKDVDAWRVSDDRVIGGFSKCSAAFVSSQRDLDRHVSGEAIQDSIEEEDTTQSEHDAKSDFTPFLRWEGTLDTSVGLQNQAQRSGFAAIRSPTFAFDGANLQGLYNAFEVTCRTDGRLYTLNLEIASFMPNDIYQGHIPALSNKRGQNDSNSNTFEKIIMPLTSFDLTSSGRKRAMYVQLDDEISVESVGVVLMDGQNGDFQFDLARIRAVNVHEEYGVFEKVPDTNAATPSS